MKVIITKKNTRKYNKTKKYKLKGGEDFDIANIKTALELKLKDIYNFFPTAENKTIGSRSEYMFELVNIDTNITVNIRKNNIKYQDIKDSVDNLNNTNPEIKEKEYKKYEIIFPDYHGEYKKDITDLQLCPKNVYICFSSL